LGFVILIIFFVSILCVCMGKCKPILCVLGNCSNKYPCHMWVGLLMKWWTMNKTNIDVHIGKSYFFQVAHFIKHSNMRCGVHFPHVMTKLKRDENLANLIWINKVFYAMGLKDVWDSQNWTRFSSKKKCERIIWFVNYHELKMIHSWQIPSYSIFISNLHCALNMCFPNYTHCFMCMSILGFKIPPRRPS